MIDFDSSKNNFNILRIFLAIVVLFYHIGKLADVELLSSLPGKIAVQSFFIISGFLICKSYFQNSNIKEYFLSRALRIYPLYFVVICFSFLFGLLSYNFGVIDYIQEGGGAYLLFNLVFLNFFQPDLPGLFIDNPLNSAVNGSLWTIKIEVAFYILVPIVFGYFTKYLSTYKLIVFTGGLSLFIGFILNIVSNEFGLSPSFNKQIPTMWIYFMLGAYIYHFKPKKISYWYLIPISIGLFINQDVSMWYYPLLQPFLVSLFVYLLAFNIRLIKVPKKIGDISYGIYILHYPLIQTFIEFGYFDKPMQGIFITLVTVLFLSFLSWHYFESILIKYKKP